MNIDWRAYGHFLEQVAKELDIPPAKYMDAVNRYRAVGSWLEGGTYPGSHGIPSISPQGSFRLGTVTRPVRDGIEAAYDIDLVCELLLPMELTDPPSIKHMVGNRLRENATYARMLDEEGKRCWTLEYAEEDNVGFHLDVLPAVPDHRSVNDTSIAITNKIEGEYSWSASNPRGYAEWFESRNGFAFLRSSATQKQAISDNLPQIFARVDDVPDQLVRTPLQRAIQIMKRHRDIRFNQKQRLPFAPISIIITTLAAHLYRDEDDVYTALSVIIAALRAHALLVNGVPINARETTAGVIERRPDGTWYIGNPSNPAENFADRWHEDNHARARAFFDWVDVLQEDLIDVVGESNAVGVRDRLSRALGEAPVAKFVSAIIPATVVAAPRIQITSQPKPWSPE